MEGGKGRGRWQGGESSGQVFMKERRVEVSVIRKSEGG